MYLRIYVAEFSRVINIYSLQKGEEELVNLINRFLERCVWLAALALYY